MNEYITPHFKYKEFACKCGCGYGLKKGDVIQELADVLEEIRVDLGKPIIINSGIRCTKHNASVGGVQGSLHTLGFAADIVVRGMTPNEVQEYLLKKYPNTYGIGRYNSFTHIDMRSERAYRWDNRK